MSISALRLLGRGPPWYRRTVLLVVVLCVVVLFLSVAVVYLLFRVSDAEPPSSAKTDDPAAKPDTEAETEYDRVRRLCLEADGPLPQQEIVNATEWSEAKVSRVVSRLAEQEKIEKTRMGRRNLIRLTPEEHASDTEA